MQRAPGSRRNRRKPLIGACRRKPTLDAHRHLLRFAGLDDLPRRLCAAHAAANGTDAGGEQTEVTLKSLNAPRNGLAHRTEFSQRIDGADMKAVVATGDGIGERIRELIGERPLTPLFKANTRRERQQLLEADSDLALAEVDLDETSIEAPSGISQQLKRVEVECINATPAALEPFVEAAARRRTARARGDVQVSCRTAGGRPQPAGQLELASLEISRDAAVRRNAVCAAAPILRRGAGKGTAGARRFRRPPYTRCASRRGTSTCCCACSRATAHAGRRRRAERCARSSKRSAQCAIATCSSNICTARPPRSPALIAQRSSPCASASTQQRVQARARLLHMLDSTRTRSWIAHWLEQLRLGTASGARAREANTAAVARDLIRSAAAQVAQARRPPQRRLERRRLPRVRIRAKRLRYALDAFGSLYGDAAREYLDALAKLQHVLGEYHDSTVRARIVRGPRHARTARAGRHIVSRGAARRT